MWHGLARWLLKTKKIALVNILAGNIDLVPEFIPWYGSNDAGDRVRAGLASRSIEADRSRNRNSAT